MKRDALLALLDELSRVSARSLKPNPGRVELRSAFQALQRLIVDFPKGRPLSSGTVDTIRPIFEEFGDVDATDAQRIWMMIESAIGLTTKSDADFWRQLFILGDSDRCGQPSPAARVVSMRVRLGIADSEPVSTRQNAVVYEFATMLLQIAKRVFREHEIETMGLHGGEGCERSDTTVTYEIGVSSERDRRKLPIEKVELAGDAWSWMLSSVRAKVDPSAAPETLVRCIGKPKDIVRLEGEVGTRFGSTIEQLVSQSCLMAVQYFPEYFSDPKQLPGLLMNILEQRLPEKHWMDTPPYCIAVDAGRMFRIQFADSEVEFIDPDAEIPLGAIPDANCGSFHEDEYRFELSHAAMIERVLPGAIANAIALRWLEGMSVKERTAALSYRQWKVVRRIPKSWPSHHQRVTAGSQPAERAR